MKSFPKPKTVKLTPYEKALKAWGKKKVALLLTKGMRGIKKELKQARKKRVLLTPIPKLVKKADSVFSAWIRTRDMYICFAVDIRGEREKCKGAIQCCHLIKRSFKPTRFDESNCNAGCAHHNYNHDHGFNARPEIYTAWYIKEYGAIPYQDLIDKSRQYHKWTRDELQEIIKRYEIKG